MSRFFLCYRDQVSPTYPTAIRSIAMPFQSVVAALREQGADHVPATRHSL